MKVLTVVGARPQFIKCGPVSAELRLRHHELLVHTGQHYDDSLSGRFFRDLDLPQPDYELGIGSASHAEQTGAMMAALEEVMLNERPDLVLVYGDTNSTLAGALAASKVHIPVAHVEAGLRSFNRRMPEEINRVLTDHVSALLFCPTETARANLAREGIGTGVHVTGDVMLDAALRDVPGAAEAEPWLASRGLTAREYYLATLHRAENTDDPARLQGIIDTLTALDLPVLLPLHPRTAARLKEHGFRLDGAIRPALPLGYREMLAAERYAKAVLTDSGGVQKEAFLFRTPCLTLRDETEWVETVESGWNVLVGAEPSRIADAVRDLPLGDPNADGFGKGDAARQIVEVIDTFARDGMPLDVCTAGKSQR